MMEAHFLLYRVEYSARQNNDNFKAKKKKKRKSIVTNQQN